jgi:starvation-inducible DNA-binding protein
MGLGGPRVREAKRRRRPSGRRRNRRGPLNIGLTATQRDPVVRLLTALLADEYVLYTKIRNFRRNVSGPHFDDLHKFFERQHDALAEVVDEVAERIRALGGVAIGTLAEFQRHARLREGPGRNPTASGMVAELLTDHETLIRTLRVGLDMCGEAHHGVGIADFPTGLLEKRGKLAWMLRATVARDGGSKTHPGGALPPVLSRARPSVLRRPPRGSGRSDADHGGSGGARHKKETVELPRIKEEFGT